MVLEMALRDLGVTATVLIQLFKDQTTVKKYLKGENIFLQGQKNQKEYIILSGVCHRFCYSEKDEITTTGFYMSKQVVTPHFARTNKGKSIFTLQALTDVLIAEIPVVELDNLRNNYKEFNDFGQRIVQAELGRAFYNEIVYRSYSAEERLFFLRKHFPNLENMISHNIIASYLGITNVSLSRLRNNIKNKK